MPKLEGLKKPWRPSKKFVVIGGGILVIVLATWLAGARAWQLQSTEATNQLSQAKTLQNKIVTTKDSKIRKDSLATLADQLDAHHPCNGQWWNRWQQGSR